MDRPSCHFQAEEGLFGGEEVVSVIFLDFGLRIVDCGFDDIEILAPIILSNASANL